MARTQGGEKGASGWRHPDDSSVPRNRSRASSVGARRDRRRRRQPTGTDGSGASPTGPVPRAPESKLAEQDRPGRSTQATPMATPTNSPPVDHASLAAACGKIRETAAAISQLSNSKSRAAGGRSRAPAANPIPAPVGEPQPLLTNGGVRTETVSKPSIDETLLCGIVSPTSETGPEPAAVAPLKPFNWADSDDEPGSPEQAKTAGPGPVVKLPRADSQKSQSRPADLGPKVDSKLDISQSAGVGYARSRLANLPLPKVPIISSKPPIAPVPVSQPADVAATKTEPTEIKAAKADSIKGELAPAKPVHVKPIDQDLVESKPGEGKPVALSQQILSKSWVDLDDDDDDDDFLMVSGAGGYGSTGHGSTSVESLVTRLDSLLSVSEKTARPGRDRRRRPSSSDAPAPTSGWRKGHSRTNGSGSDFPRDRPSRPTGGSAKPTPQSTGAKDRPAAPSAGPTPSSGRRRVPNVSAIDRLVRNDLGLRSSGRNKPGPSGGNKPSG